MLAKPARRVLVVDDESYTRSTTAELLRQYGFEVAEAENAVMAKRSVVKFDPDAMVVDIELGKGPSGLDLINALRRTHGHIAFVLLSNFAPNKADFAELKHVAYLSKRENSNINKLVSALEDMLQDKDPAIDYPVLAPEKIALLTKGQLEILKMIAAGATNQEIALKRDASIRAIEKSIERIYSTLNIKRDGKNTPRLVAARIYFDALGHPNMDQNT